MKSIINFYLLIFVPIGTIVLLASSRLIGSEVFACLLLIYALIYHPFISAQRLIAAGKISKNKFWYSFIPTWNWKYFSFLFFNLRD